MSDDVLRVIFVSSFLTSSRRLDMTAGDYVFHPRKGDAHEKQDKTK